MYGSLYSLIPGLLKGGLGLYQTIQGNKLAGSNQRPVLDYQVPQSALDALNIYKGIASSTELPGQRIAEQKLSARTANAVNDLERAATSSSDIVSGINRAYGNEMSGVENLSLAAAENYNRNQQNYAEQKNRIAGYEDQEQRLEFDWNNRGLYEENAAASSALQGSGIMNLFSGASDTAGIGANEALLKKIMQENPSFFRQTSPSGNASATVGEQSKPLMDSFFSNYNGLDMSRYSGSYNPPPGKTMTGGLQWR